MITRPLILASQSPRRSFLLKEAGFDFTIKTRPIDEVFPDDLPSSQVAEYLAVLKAKAVTDFVKDDAIVLTADSIVVLGNTIFGKPKDYEDAFRIIKQLSGNIHEVITGVCLMDKDKQVAFSDVSKVYFKTLTDEEIHYYITNYKPYDKAGAYAIQEWIGLTKIEKIEGSYHNIMGLPTHRVYEELMKF